jgi:glycosyltransferase involved in cell wall biosynthesis
MNIHLLHPWLVSMGGGEKVLEQICKLFPKAPIHTLVYNKDKTALSKTIQEHKIVGSVLDKVPGSVRHYQSFLPFFPWITQRHSVKADFIISSDAAFIKGMNNANKVPHVCYCHSPPRYIWDLKDEYLNVLPSVKRRIFESIIPHLRNFDQKTAKQVDCFIANSHFIKERIKGTYNREAVVIYPHVDVEKFRPDQPSHDYYLIISRLVPYKRVELAVRAFNKMGKKLVVIGEGSERKKLESIAENNVKIVGAQPFGVVKNSLEHCAAFIFPGIEDFGITPLEAQASGKPVIAFRGGGALETIREGETGLFFREQTVDSLVNSVYEFEKKQAFFKPDLCRKQAERFSPEQFRQTFKTFLVKHYPSYFTDFDWGI